MDYRRFGNTIYARLDRGEEILAQVKAIALREDIKLASVSGLGAIDDFTLGIYRPAEQKYYPNHFTGDHEVVSLTGTITTQDGAFYCHLHLSAGDGSGAVVGGHLNRAVISATAELVLQISDGTVERRFDPSIGLNLFAFGEA